MGPIGGEAKDLLAGHAEQRQQPGKPVLGMAFGQGVPGPVGERGIEARQHHGPAIGPGDDGQQIGGRRDRTGGARRHHPIPGRRGGPVRAVGGQQAVAPLCGTDGALFGQFPGPEFGHDLEEFQSRLPMLGEALGNQIGETLEAKALGLHLVEQAGQRGCQLRRLAGVGWGRPGAAAEGHHQAGQDQLPAQAADHRRKRLGGLGLRSVGRRAGGLAGDQQLVLVEIAQRHHAGQQQGRPARSAEERLGQGPHRAAGRQQDGHPSQRQGIVPMVAADPKLQPPGQGIDEGNAGVDGIDTQARGAHGRRSSGTAPRAAEANSSPAGVPIWNQRPVCSIPKARPEAMARS